MDKEDNLIIYKKCACFCLVSATPTQLSHYLVDCRENKIVVREDSERQNNAHVLVTQNTSQT